MSLHCLETTLRLPIDRAEAWAFFSDPRNLAAITPPDMGFEITSELPERVYPGLIVTYRVRPLARIPVTWVTEITHVAEGERFVDAQRMGPYRLWHHQHHFRDVAGGTEVRDIVHYSVLPGPLGSLVNRAVVRGRLQAIFNFRQGMLEQRFGKIPQPS